MQVPAWAQDIVSTFRGKMNGDEITIKQCPYCHNDRWNFQISINKCVFHCWVCSNGGTAAQFLRDQKIAYNPEDLKVRIVRKSDEGITALPNNKKIVFNDSRIAEMARQYLASRDVTVDMMIEWDMRIGIGGDQSDWGGMDYFGWTIIPMYGIGGLEYFIAVNHTMNNKYHLPKIGKDRFVPKRRGSNSIIIVEGIFDALSAWRYTTFDVLPLFGKFLGDKQKELLLRVNYDRIYCCLDNDAIKESTDLADDLFKAGGKSYLVNLPEDKDPNDIREDLGIYIEQAVKFGLTTRSRLRRERLLQV